MVELSRRLVQIVPEEVWPQSIDSAIFTARSRNVYQTLVLLHLNGLVAEDLVLDEKNLAGVKMPNRDGFVPDQRPDVKAKR